MKKIIILIGIALSIISCEELEVDIQSLEKTNFTLTASLDQGILLVNENLELNLSITLEEPVTEEINFSMEYFDTGIDGKLSINGIEYNQGEVIDNIPKGNISLEYLGTSIGSGTLTFQVTASNGISKNLVIPIDIEKTDFDFTILFDKDQNYINERTPFNINIETKGTENLTYKAYFKNVEGKINLESEDQGVSQNRMFDISEGITFGEFTGTRVQDSNIEFVIEASNGITKSQIINFKTLLTNFEVIMTPDTLKAFFTQDIMISIFIKRPDNLEQRISYKMFFTAIGFEELKMQFFGFNSGNALQGYEYDLGEYSTTGGAILKRSQNIVPETGAITLYFQDSNGATYEKSINVDYYDN
jgi:hypothetical protein